MESFLEAWDLICDYCKKQVTDVSYETWFSKLVPISLDFGAGVAIIQAPNEFNKSTIERGFHKCLNDAVQSVFGEAFTYKLITPMEKKEKERVPDDDEYEYTFETFIEQLSELSENGSTLSVNSFYIIDDAKQRDKMTEEFYSAVKKEIALYQELSLIHI